MNASGSRTSLPRLALVGVVASLLALAVLPCSAAGEDAAAVAREQRAHEAQVLVAQGRQYLGAKHYAEARDAFERALRLTPGDAACAKLLAQARTALGTGSQTAILDHMRERRETTGRMIALQLDTTLFEAERELKANPESAAERAQRVLEGVAYVRDAQRAAELRRRAEAVLAKAKTQRDDKLDAVRTRELAKAREAAHRNAGVRNAQLRAMREQAWKFLEANNQDKARELAEAMLHIDPSNPDAQKLQEELRQARVAVPASLQGMSAGRKKAMTEFMSEVERELIPLEAAEIVRAGRTRGEPKDLFARPMEKWERDLREKLREPIEMAFRGTPLDAAVKQIAEVAGITVIVDPEAQNGKEPVYFDARMPAESLLRWVGRFGGLEYQLRDGAVVLAQPGGVLDEPVRRTYDISSLVTPPNEPEPPPQVGPVEPVSVVHAAPGGNSTVNPDIIGQGWADYLKNTVAAETWGQVLQERPQYTINYRNGRIVVVHTPEVHAEIEQLLNNFRRARNLQVHMVGRFVEINAAYLDSFNFEIGSFDSNGTFGDPVPDPDGKWKSIVGLTDNAPDRQALTRFPNFFSGGDGLHLEYTRLGDSDVSLLLEAVMKKRQGTILTAPRLTCFNTQRANLQVLVNYNYVRRVTTDDEPEIGNIPEGIIFDIQPFVSADRRYITLILQPQMRELVELNTFHYSTEVNVIDQGNVAIGILQESFVQLPQTRLRSLGTTVTVPNGGTLLTGGFTEVEERHALAGIPFIENLPFLGRLLRGYDRAEGRRSLMILVSAETVPDLFTED